MSNPPPPPPVKVSPTPTGAAATTQGPQLPTPQYPGLSTIPQAPTYTFVEAQSPSLRITTATFIYGSQSIDIVKYLKKSEWNGYVEYPVTTLMNDLKDDNKLSEQDAQALNLKPPSAHVEWFEAGDFKKMDFGKDAIIIVGKLNWWGLLMKKPGELSWKMAEYAGTFQFWITVVLVWILMVVWAYKLWDHMLNGGLNMNTATPATFGEYGQWFAKLAGLVAPYGPTKYFMAFAAALAPVWSFCIQFTMWYFVDSQIPETGLRGNAPAAAGVDTTSSWAQAKNFLSMSRGSRGATPPAASVGIR